MRLLTLTTVMLLQAAHPGTPFNPWAPLGYRTINGIEFAPDALTMYVALEPAVVAKVENREAPAGAPEVALYQSRRENGVWSRPELMPFAGRYKDYEAALSPDGTWMLFNSWRPMPDGRASNKNNLWLARQTAGRWSDPIYLAGINRPDTEESYAAIGPDGTIVFLGEGPADAHGPDYNLYQTRLTGDEAAEATPFPPAATSAGESDPWFARDGGYVIFTRWDRARDWQVAVDLYITFRNGAGWTTPVPLTAINDPAGPDYAVSIAGSPERIYWKRRGGTMSAEWAPIIASARAAAANVERAP